MKSRFLHGYKLNRSKLCHGYLYTGCSASLDHVLCPEILQNKCSNLLDWTLNSNNFNFENQSIRKIPASHFKVSHVHWIHIYVYLCDELMFICLLFRLYLRAEDSKRKNTPVLNILKNHTWFKGELYLTLASTPPRSL